MEKKKALRTPLRTAFTKAVNTIEQMFNDEQARREDLQAVMDTIELKAERIMELDKVITEEMVEQGVSEEDLQQEFERISEYEAKLFLCRRKIERAMQDFYQPKESEADYDTVITRMDRMKEKKYKLPKIEFTKFGGEIKEWLPFWAQFKKIHNDEDMPEEDKFHYLKQSTFENSKAREIVDSFPMTAENYQKVIKHLVDRFGNKDTLVEVYVRELLKLVMVNVMNPTKKIAIASLYDKMETQLRALESLEVTRNDFVAILYPLVESCLPEEILRAWERHRIMPMNLTIDKLSHLMLFLKGEVESEERISLARNGFNEQVKKGSKREEKSNETPTAAGLLVQEKIRKMCIFCKKPHYSDLCYEAKKLTLSERQKICEEQRACFNCLSKGHLAKECMNKSKLKCQNCGGRHRQLMCRNGESKTKANATLSVTKEQEQLTATSNLLVIKKEETVLSTLLIRVRNGEKTKVVRVAIDSGAHKTYMVKKLINELGLESNGQEKLIHELFGGHQIKETTHNRYKIQAENLNGLYNCSFDVLEQERICYDVNRIQKGEWLEKLQQKNVTLSDVGIGSSEIELLIGNDVAGKLLIEIIRLEGYENFVAMNYSLGWTVMGKVPIHSKADKTLLVHTLFVNEANVSDLWRLDLIGIEDTAETRKKEICMEATIEEFKKTLRVNQEGRFEILLPFMKGCPPIKSNRKIAEQRLLSMSSKISHELKIVCHKIFDDWEAGGIIEEVPEDELENFGHYLPHKPVLNPNSLTTPVRPVFDASAKESKSLSLNDCLVKGPNLLEVVTSIIIRFRLWQFGLLSDIKKAFLQISIHPDYRDYLRFLWWEKNSSGKVKVYRHRRLVFGLTCSSFVLAALINEILDTAPPEYQETVKKLEKANYVDNCVTSIKDEASVLKFINEATQLLATKQFELRGWVWNNPNSLSDPDKEISVLGLIWNLAQDMLICDIDKGNILENEKITKQKILSITHQIFDPIGFTTPLVILPKMLLQECWALKIGWKVEVPEQISKRFRKWCQQLSAIKTIQVPRWIGLTEVNINSTALHVFADASKMAYTANVFIRFEQVNEVKVQLVQAKTRIAPLKKLSINRLELLGCLIAARLSSKVIKDMALGDIKCTYWTDSANALHWITNNDQWGIYVWNRVEEIRKLTKIESWRHIPGDKNPADLPSRGCSAKQLIESSWWEGPEWLKQPEENWPKSAGIPDEDVINTERKKIVICNWERARAKVDTSWMSNLKINYEQMIRVTAIMKRLIKNRKKAEEDRIRGKLSVTELSDAEICIIKMVQNEAFTSNDPVLNNMELVQDEQQVLRVKTRVLRREDIPSFKAPALLPKKHPVVRAIIEYYHRENAHANTLTLMVLLREKFWILKSRVAVRKVVRECLICRWFSAKPFATEPAQLPLDRIRDASLFEVTGVDLTGHLFLQDGSKAWIVLYTCAIYRAVKLDLVTSLSTEAFIRSLRRFIATDGRPKIIYSDNGTNLKGTDNSLKDVDWDQIHQTAAMDKIDWRFIPSKAPWWGGWWERLIGVVKEVLKRVLGKSSLEYDEMRTILCEVAAVVNSRPLTYMTEDPTELQALSPSMFLNDLTEYGTPDLDSVDAMKLNERQQQRLQIKKELRERFRSEYLSQLIQRNVQKASRPIEIGELVLMANENQKRTLWPLAKVVDIYPSSDGVIRVARVKTINGELQRPVKKLIPLEIRQGESVPTFGLSAAQIKEIETLDKPKVQKVKSTKKKNKEKMEKLAGKESTEHSTPVQHTSRGRMIKPVQRLGFTD